MPLNDARLEVVAVHFSTVCGAKCSFCYAEGSRVTHQPPVARVTVEQTIRKLAEEGVKEILFVGGDPVIHPDFHYSIQMAKELGLTVSVLSNSWALSPRETFEAQLDCIDYVEATILGHTAELHDSITRQPNSYTNLVANLKRIAAHGKKIGACLNAMPQTLPHMYDTVKALVQTHQLPIRSVMLQRIIPSGGSAGSHKFGLSLSDIAYLMEQVERIHLDFGVPVAFEDPVPFCTVNEKYHYLLSRCDWGYRKGSINANGTLNRCGADDHGRLGSIFEGSLQEKWRTHPILLSFRSKKYLPDECQSCPHLERCGGGCPLSCGTSSDHDVDFLYLQRKQAEADAGKAAGCQNTEEMRVRHTYANDWETISALERRLFPGENGLFTPESLRRHLQKYPEGVMVAEQGGRVVGYLSVFPLTADGAATVERDNVTTVCHLHQDCIGPSLKEGCSAAFVEVIAFAPECSFRLRRQLWKRLLALLEGFKGRIYSCPYSERGGDILRRHGFNPLRTGNPHTLYFRDGYNWRERSVAEEQL